MLTTSPFTVRSCQSSRACAFRASKNKAGDPHHHCSVCWLLCFHRDRQTDERERERERDGGRTEGGEGIGVWSEERERERERAKGRGSTVGPGQSTEGEGAEAVRGGRGWGGMIGRGRNKCKKVKSTVLRSAVRQT